MNILWLSHLVPYPPKGGVLQRSFNLIREMSKDHQIYLVAFNQTALLPSQDAVAKAIAQLKMVCPDVQVVSIPCERIIFGRYLLYLKTLFSSKPYTLSWLESKEMEHLIQETITKYDIDLVHFDTISLAPFYRVSGKCKKVLNHHNVESQMMLRRSSLEKNFFKKLYMRQEGNKIQKYEQDLCTQFDLNITCSPLDSDRLRGMISNLKIQDIPNGVDLSYFYPLNQGKDRSSLIFVGGMKWYPNRSAMLFFAKEIWPLLKKEMPDVTMTVIGRTPPGQLQKLAQRDSHFRVTGFVEDVRPYIDKAMVYVCPIRDGGGTKLKILDALAMGKPIVAHPIALEGIDAEPEKHVLTAVTPQEFVHQIVRLLSDSRLCHQLSESGRQLVMEKYDFEKIGKKLCRIYNKLVESR